MKKNASLIIPIAIITISCTHQKTKTSRLSENQLLGRGEWLDTSDTINGISVRENKIAFFKDMKFYVDQLKQYSILDSIYKDGEIETAIGEYLIVENGTDTLKYKILKRDKKVISLIDSNGVKKSYKFWR